MEFQHKSELENDVNILTKLTVGENAVIIDYIKTYKRRYNRKLTKPEALSIILGLGIERIKGEIKVLKNQITNYETGKNSK
ncbi:MAG: hypothetical protein ACK518_00785 [bacterium]|jgi:hypothetical protein